MYARNLRREPSATTRGSSASDRTMETVLQSIELGRSTRADACFLRQRMKDMSDHLFRIIASGCAGFAEASQVKSLLGVR